MKKVFVHEMKTIIQNPDSKFNYFAWPSLARLHDGTLAAVCSGFRIGHVCPFGKVVMAKSADDGKTWSSPCVVMDTPLDDRDAGILPFGDSSVMITSFNNTVAFQQNTNKMREQGSPEQRLVEGYLAGIDAKNAESKYLGYTYVISHDNGVTFGDIGFSPVTAPHGPCLLENGDILYVGRSASDGIAQKEDRIECHKFVNGEFEFVSAIETIPGVLSCEPAAIDIGGKIIVHIRVQNEKQSEDGGMFTIFQSESSDGGKTFSKPRQILSDTGGAPAHLMKHSSGALVSVYGYRKKPFGIKAMISYDGGENWDTDYVLYDGASSLDLGYPASVERKDGTILTVFYEREENWENFYEESNGGSAIKQIVWSLPQ
jgi:sialidase-1